MKIIDPKRSGISLNTAIEKLKSDEVIMMPLASYAYLRHAIYVCNKELRIRGLLLPWQTKYCTAKITPEHVIAFLSGEKDSVMRFFRKP